LEGQTNIILKDDNAMQYKSQSLTQLAWKRLLKDKLSIIGLIIIGIAAIISILGYIITPDSTPNANEQKSEFLIRKPRFSCNVLKSRKNLPKDETGFFKKMFFGKPSDYATASIYEYHFSDVNIVVEEYTGNKPNNGPIQTLNMAEVVYAIDQNTPIKVDEQKSNFTFKEVGKNEYTVKSYSELKDTIIKHFIYNKKYLLGTDRAGRDMLSRLMIGTRISLLVGFISVFIALAFGLVIGSLAGFYRGWVDNVLMWLINVVWSIPTLLLIIAITLFIGKGIWQVFIAVGLTQWVEIARLVRGQIMSLREKEFIESAKSMGFSNFRIIFRHILPNIIGPVIVVCAANFASAILIEAGLSFLGLGAQPPAPSWGAMISAHRGYILIDAAYLAFLPGLCIMLLVLAFMFVGNGLRAAIDTRSYVK
jgi:peptide/nickel transport system permease protein